MYNVLVVDDEMIFRKGITHLIHESNLEWTVIGEARDGLEALEMIQDQRPHLVITDIRMPRMDGIQLQATVAEQYPSIRCIVLSGHNDFEYARHSIRSGARDYLLKPVNKQELYTALGKVEAELTKENESQSLAEHIPSQQVIRQQILSSLIHGNSAYDEGELLDQANISFPHTGIYCLIVQLDRDSVTEQRYQQNDPELFFLYIQQFVREIILEPLQGYTFIDHHQVVALINSDHSEQTARQIRSLSGQLIRSIKRISQMTVTIGIGGGVADLESVPQSYREAETALLYRLISGGDQVLVYESSTTNTMPLSRLEAADRHFLEQLLAEENGQELTKQVQAFIERLCRQISNPEVIQQQICKILLECYEIALDYNVLSEWLNKQDMGGILQNVLLINERQQLARYCGDLLYSLYELIQRKEGHVIHAVDQVVRYLEEHYAEPITLSLMAEKVYLNASYLSSLFKNRLGHSFVEVLTDIRIREAIKRLIHSDEKIATIAYDTGFVNIRHFNRVFKTETGTTPKQYRDSRRHYQHPV